MSWDEATKIWAEQTGPDDGFYLSLQVRFFALAYVCSVLG